MAKSKQPKPDSLKPITQTYVIRVSVEASGWQMWSIKATSEKEAIEKVKTEGGEFYGEEIEVGSCDYESADAWVETPETPKAESITWHDLSDISNLANLGITFKPGMAWALYTDAGPSGICGQSMDITCPHTYLHVWPNETAMRKEIEENELKRDFESQLGRNGRAFRTIWGVIGEFTAGGVAKLVIHPEK